MINRVSLLVATALMAAAMVAMTAVPASAETFREYCNEKQGTFDDKGTPRANDDVCITSTERIEYKQWSEGTRQAGKSDNSWTAEGTEQVLYEDTVVEDKKDDSEPTTIPDTTGEVIPDTKVTETCYDPGGNSVEDPNHKHCQPDGGPGGGKKK